MATKEKVKGEALDELEKSEKEELSDTLENSSQLSTYKQPGWMGVTEYLIEDYKNRQAQKREQEQQLPPQEQSLEKNGKPDDFYARMGLEKPEAEHKAPQMGNQEFSHQVHEKTEYEIG